MLTTAVIVLIFAAGGAWAKLLIVAQKAETDLKGLSIKISNIATKNDKRYYTLSLAIMECVRETDQAKCAAMLDEGWKG